MPHKHLRILNAPDATWWEPRKNLPHFLQPVRYSTNPCSQCPGLCCVPVGSITTVEALRMALLVNLPIDQVVHRKRLDALDVPLHKEPIAVHLDEGDVILFMHLREGQCIFLHSVGERGFCSIYDARPGICRIYPFRVEFDDNVLKVGDQFLCPTKWVQDDSVRANVRKNLARWHKDERAERALQKSWLAHDGEDRSWHAYIRFAVRHLEKHLGINADEVLKPQTRRRLGGPGA